MREVTLPKIEADSQYGVLASAQVLLAHFTDLLVGEISIGLSNLYGKDWMQRLQAEKPDFAEMNFRDPQAVLKDLARNGASQLRFALNNKLAQEHRKSFYDGLDDLLGERNAWVHRQLSETREELEGLATSADDLLFTLSKERLYSKWITSLLFSDPVNNLANKEAESLRMDLVDSDMQNIESNEIMTLGQPVSSRFLSHTYIVGEQGEILDRTSGVKLSEVDPSYLKEICVLIQNLRIGSRLRITEEGQLCSFMDDHWGFLLQVNASQWFPNHLKKSIK